MFFYKSRLICLLVKYFGYLVIAYLKITLIVKKGIILTNRLEDNMLKSALILVIGIGAIVLFNLGMFSTQQVNVVGVTKKEDVGSDSKPMVVLYDSSIDVDEEYKYHIWTLTNVEVDLSSSLNENDEMTMEISIEPEEGNEVEVYNQNDKKSTEQMVRKTAKESSVDSIAIVEQNLEPDLIENEEQSDVIFTEEDEARAWELARTNLSDSQIQRLFDIEEDGVTPEERQELKEMLHTYFSQEEQDEIWELHDKYIESGR